MNHILLLILCIVGCELVGIISGIPTSKSVKTWYRTIKKPSFNPPSWVFAPVWTTLYALMGISLFLVLISPQKSSLALLLFGLQLLANFLWSFIFFTFHKLGLAFLEILILLFLIIATVVSFWPISPWASILLMPYLFWVSFASVLTGSIWKLNSKKE